MTSFKEIVCPVCGHPVRTFKNPVPTVDIIIEIKNKIVLIQRKNPPHGWAIPGGFVDYGEAVQQAAIREALEETSLHVDITHLLGVYSDPDRDPRGHTISTVFVAEAAGAPKAADDASELALFDKTDLPKQLVFDHATILRDYFLWKKSANKSS